jgi:FkbM family methyltransferase
MDGLVVVGGYCEEEVLSAVLDNVRTGDVFWDIGANIGLHAITVRRLRPEVRVVCFEPSPFTFVTLSDNVTLSGEEIDLLNIALSSDVGYSRLSISIEGNSGNTSVKPWPVVYDTKELLSRCETAKSSFNPPESAPNVEDRRQGFELEVLSGFGGSSKTLHCAQLSSNPKVAPFRIPHLIMRLLGLRLRISGWRGQTRRE